MPKKLNFCQFCGKPANVHFTQIIGNKITKIDACPACAQEKGITNSAEFSIAALLGPHIFSEGLKAIFEGLNCSNCGCTVDKFKKTGLLGCPQCYTVFRPLIDPMLKDVQKNTAHHGKVAHKALKTNQLAANITQIEAALKAAIRDERFEDAAKYRDELKAIHSSDNSAPAAAPKKRTTKKTS